jgi:hypothetical protein
MGWWWKSKKAEEPASKQLWLPPSTLLLVHRANAEAWRGAADYDRAKKAGELGVIDVGRGKALVFGDDGNKSAWLAKESGGLLVRWVHAVYEADALAAADKSSDSTWVPTGTLFQTEAGEHVLFDASTSGAIDGGVKMKLEKGRYDVSIARVDDGKAALSVYRLYRMPDLR